MPRLVHRNPKYRKHISGQAIVTIDGKDHYLGPWGTKASRNEYDRVIGEWLQSGRRLASASAVMTVDELIAKFWLHAQVHYKAPPVARGKRPPGELGNFWDVLRPLRRLYGTTSAVDFGPLALKSLRADMIKMSWCRNVVNRQVARIKHVFKWAVSEQLLPASIHQALTTVAGLQAGRSQATESEPVETVPDEYVEAVYPFVSRQIKAMIQLQRLTGMRPTEVCIMRTCDIDMSKPIWTYTPQFHKTQHKGHKRIVFIGARGQEFLKHFLRTSLQEFIFSPAEAEADRLAKKHTQRKTPLNQGNRPGTHRTRQPRRKPGESV